MIWKSTTPNLNFRSFVVERLARWGIITIIIPAFFIWLSLGFKGAFKKSTSAIDALNASPDIALFTLALAAASLNTAWGIKDEVRRGVLKPGPMNLLFGLSIALLVTSIVYYGFLLPGVVSSDGREFAEGLLSASIWIAIFGIATNGLAEYFLHVVETTRAASSSRPKEDES
jgi:uncharacterized membrane protein